jgi:hypothetical protein
MKFYTGLPLHDENCVCSLLHQCYYSGEYVSCWNIKFPGWKRHQQGLDKARCCLFSISSPERWVNPWRKWQWSFKFSCFNLANLNSWKQEYQNNFRSYLCLWERMVQHADELNLRNKIYRNKIYRNKIWGYDTFVIF